MSSPIWVDTHWLGWLRSVAGSHLLASVLGATAPAWSGTRMASAAAAKEVFMGISGEDTAGGGGGRGALGPSSHRSKGRGRSFASQELGGVGQRLLGARQLGVVLGHDH